VINYLYILSAIYFFAPAGIANAFPPIANTFNILNGLNKPIDGGKTINGVPIFGSHKTWRGVVSEIIICTLLIQLFVFLHNYYNLNLYQTIGLDINSVNSWIFGILMSLGIIAGDVGFAFLKRRLRLKPGVAFIPFDQINYVIGAFIFLQPLIRLSLNFWIFLAVLTFLLHILCNRIGYNLGLHKAKW
jgi:CDP-2,3-bis-(O-geranylgeranyl)-sn-glycerol synthase